MCEYCFSGRACDHGSGQSPPSGCACSLAGTKRCPGCGCECASWDWGLGFAGPASVRSFFGVGDDENPGFSGYPATSKQILAAAREELGEADPADTDWLARHLPDGTYAERGDALAALCPVLSAPATDPSALVTSLPMNAIAVGTRLTVGPDQSVTLVGKNGRCLDRFGPGQYALTRESAPLAAAVSRAPAPGTARSVLTASAFFTSTREVRTSFDRTRRSRSGQPVRVQGSVTLSIASLSDLLARVGPRPRGISAPEMESLVGNLLGPVLDQTLGAHDAGELGGSSGLIEQAIRSGAAEAGLRVSGVTVESVGPVSPSDQMAALQERQRQAMAHLPPDAQAQILARMAMARERAQASRASGAGPSPAAPGPLPTSPSSPSSRRGTTCPSCHAPNPPGGKFCGSCGQPLPVSRTCPRCGTEPAPGVKFCGNCGAPLT